MGKFWKYFLFILWISYLIVAGILIFTSGFLLRRNAFTNSSSCVYFNDVFCENTTECSNLKTLPNNVNNWCLPKKAKVILLIIDALRYDFAVYNDKLQNPAPFENKLTIIKELLQSSNAKLYKFIADPPTTTMQRLKALTTGGLPTFIDAGSNFASPEINEDNVIDQMMKKNEKIVFLGDDTWINLFPNRFTRSFPFPSFNVFDLDTVDYGIINNLYSEISKNDWGLLIAHFLGVDHCGHRYGPYHSEMERKLLEMNEVIKNIVNVMNNDTILFVVGDHGMTGTGDHGGESDLEVTAALFVYSPNPLMSFEPSIKSVKQIDLTPTLATILGIPIPFSNLGAIIPDIFPINNKNQYLDNWQEIYVALRSNINQITNYIRKYSETSNEFNSETLENLETKVSLLNTKVYNYDNFKIYFKNAKKYLNLVRETCEETWINFDSISMSRGLLISFLTIFFVHLIINIPLKKIPGLVLSSFISWSLSLVIITVVVTIVCYFLSFIENFKYAVLFSTGIVSIIMLTIAVIQNLETIALHWYESTKIRLDYIIRTIFLLFLGTVFSNSYILEESKVLAFFITGLTVYNIFNCINLKQKWSFSKTKLIILGIFAGILIRMSMVFFKCREEQKYCFNYEKYHYVFTLVLLAILVSLVKMWLKNCGNLVGFSPQFIVARYIPTVIVVCSSGFWVLNQLPNEQKKFMSSLHIDSLAWTVYILVVLGFIIILMNPLFIYVYSKKYLSVYSQENVIPQIFNHFKETYQSQENLSMVYGLATIYSATFIVVSKLVCLLFALLLGDEYASSVVFMYFIVVILLVINSVYQYENASNFAQLFEVSSSSVLLWVLLSHYFFYATGHQATFPAIHWKAAFIGTGGIFNSNIIPAFLIGINTFGSYIFMGLTLPLLIIGPFTLKVMLPGLTTKSKMKDLKRGEIILFEENDLFMRGVFVLVCKYILFHGVRMFACMLAVTIHCRHLMVWSIFAPKLIFEGISIMVSLGSVLISYLLLIRINNQVQKFINNLEKQNR